MMTNAKETAEQKLLKMIEASAGPAAVPSKTKEKVKAKQSVLSIIKTANKILIVGILIAAFFLLAEVAVGAKLLGKKISFKTGQPASQRTLGLDDIIPQFQKVSFYLSGTKKRNIFVPYEKKKKKTIEITESNKRIAELTSDLRLVGVSWLDRIDTASVMIEDTEKKITYFLQKGEKLGDIIVKTIYADSAVLGYENEETTIKYDKSQM